MQGGRGSRQSLPGYSVLTSQLWWETAAVTITALMFVCPNNLVHLHILSSMYKPLLEEPKCYPNHDKPLRVDSQAGGKEETENKRQKSPNQSKAPK